LAVDAVVEGGVLPMLADGGRFVIRYDHRDTGRSVRSLVLSTSGALPSACELPPPTEEFARFLTTAQVDWSDATSVIEYLLAYARARRGQRPFDETAARELARRDVKRACNVAAAQNHDAIPDDGRSHEPLASITAPTLVIYRAADPDVPARARRGPSRGDSRCEPDDA
jgi:pimeloyl-ACP methyl ester carboxylesterase